MICKLKQVATINTRIWLRRLVPALLIACLIGWQYSTTFQISFVAKWKNHASIKAKLIDKDNTRNIQYLTNSDVSYSAPVCDNFLTNFSSGKWMKRSDMLKGYNFQKERQYWIQKEKEFDKLLQQYWIDRGIGSSFTGRNGKCGYNIHQTKVPGSKWPEVGSWCDKNSNRPCCNNMDEGICQPRTAGSCKCDKCVDMTTLLHAETSRWIVYDNRCKWRNYTAEEACNILADSPYDQIYFAGDSMLRNFYQALQMIITGDPVSGHRITHDDISQKCRGQELFYWPECRMVRHIPRKFVCGDGRSFSTSRIGILGVNQGVFFNDSIQTIAGKPNTLLIIAVGIHLAYNFNKVHQYFLKPVMELVEQFYKKRKTESPSEKVERWPKLIVFSSQKVGLLKPPKYLHLQGHSQNARFHEELKLFCDENDIPFFNFVPLTNQILSFDGTHHAFDVNMMKAQMFLNYIAGQK